MTAHDQTSRDIIGMALRRVREGGGSYRTDTSGPWRQQAPDMNVWLAPVRFAIIGGLATRLYMPERMTLDVTLGTDLLSYSAVRQAMETSGSP